MRAKPLFVMVLAALWTVSCLASTGTEVRAEVAPNFSHESLNPGDPLAGGVLYLLDGDEIILETVLDKDGTATVEPDPGVYDVQVRLDSEEGPLCFWGETRFDVEFPSSPVQLEAGFICAGG